MVHIPIREYIMTYLFKLFSIGCFALLLPSVAQAKLRIFACEPEWAALAGEISGDNADIFTATHAGQDPHYIRARPSLIAQARHADIMFCSGAGLEVGWLPILLEKASVEVQPGAVGYLMASAYVPILEKPEKIDRSMGDIHPEGNPHIHLNPYNIVLVAKELTKRLKLLDVANADFYQNRSDDFIMRWQAAIVDWEKTALSLKDKKVVVHHRTFSYLLDWLHMENAASLEPKPGIPPTTQHLEKLLKQFAQNPAYVIIRGPYEPEDASTWLSQKTSIPAIMLPYTIDGDDKSNDLFALFEQSVNQLINAGSLSARP